MEEAYLVIHQNINFNNNNVIKKYERSSWRWCKMHRTVAGHDEMVCFSLNFVNDTAGSIKAEIYRLDEKCTLHKDDPAKLTYIDCYAVNLLLNYLINNSSCYSVITWVFSYFDNYLFI
jgi:hypothetical protein